MVKKTVDKKPDNTQKARPLRDEKGRWLKGTPSPNPAGSPKMGESWASVISEISNMTVEEIITLVGKDNDLGRSFIQMPRKIQMKKLVVARVLAALMFEPTSGLWNSLMERAEGKIKEEITGDVSGTFRFVNETDHADPE